MVVYCQCALCGRVFLWLLTVSVPSVAGCFYGCLRSVCPLWPGVSMLAYCQCALCGQVSVSVFTNY